MQTTTKDKYQTQAAAELESAIKTLEKFTQSTTKSKAASTIKRIGTLLINKLYRRPNDSSDLSEELNSAVETLKNNYLLIENYQQQGSLRQRQLAQLALELINRYNTREESKTAKMFPWNLKIASLLFSPKSKVPKKIELPFTAKALYNTEIGNKVSHKFSYSLERNPNHIAPTQQELDMFRMQAIVLFKKHRIPMHRETIFDAPITIQSRVDKDDIIQLLQRLTPFPGETIELKGAFKRNPEEILKSIPISDSFHLSSKATQTGFPHPLQHTGWALTSQLIPLCPLELEQLPLFAKLYRSKRDIAFALLPEGHHNKKAKDLLKIKKEAFEANRNELIKLHEQLAMAILSSAPEILISVDDNQTITDFYKALKTQPHAYDVLAQAHHTINELAIAGPYAYMQKYRIENSFSPELIAEKGYKLFFSILEQKSHQETKDFLSKNPGINSAYIECMVRIISAAAHLIIMQEISELINFPPPLLNNFERKIQASAYKQLVLFIKKMEKPIPNLKETYLLLKEELQQDIDLFTAESTDSFVEETAIINELEEYYNARYQKELYQ